MTTTDTEIVAKIQPGLGIRRSQVNSGLQMGPVKHLAAERQRLQAIEWPHFSVRAVGVSLGAEISGVDLTSSLTAPVIDDIRRALYEYKVIFFRDQPLTSAQHVRFAQRFGELEIHPFIPPNAEHPELVRFEKSPEVGGYENAWHHDVTWRETPSMGAVLHAVKVPEVGGDTLFADMCAAYDGLDDEIQTRIDGLYAEHDYLKAFSSQVPPGREAEFRTRYPVVQHPVVCTHPATGRRLLYVNAIFTSRIVGPPAGEAADLLELLCRQAHTVEYQYRFNWQKDSVVFWDNRAVQHYASSDYWPEIRVMERASIIGTKPL